MKVRVKYTKTGPLRFISHLDVMRYFQKALRRAGLDVAYSKGFSPHQLISFAAPMPLGMTSIGEYFDADFNSVTTKDDMIQKFNSNASPYLLITDIVLLPDNAKNSMSVVSASDYRITLSAEGKKHLSNDDVKSMVRSINSSSQIEILKKTKKKEEVTDIKPSIYKLCLENETEDEKEDGIATNSDLSVYMMLAAGSVDNLKPELVLQAMCQQIGVSYSRFDFDILRLETYMKDENEQPIALIDAGHTF